MWTHDDRLLNTLTEIPMSRAVVDTPTLTTNLITKGAQVLSRLSLGHEHAPVITEHVVGGELLLDRVDRVCC